MSAGERTEVTFTMTVTRAGLDGPMVHVAAENVDGLLLAEASIGDYGGGRWDVMLYTGPDEADHEVVGAVAPGDVLSTIAAHAERLG